jgi:GNAT superfamily N-acetyltransferase
MYKLQTGDLAKASTVLGEAFRLYPIFEYIIPDSSYRKVHLKYLCCFLLRLGISKGEVVAPSESIEGVSIWLPPTGAQSSGIDVIRAGLLNLFFQVNTRTFVRFMKIGRIKGTKRATIIRRPYYLCDMIGVDPRFQSRGFGRKMVVRKLMACDGVKMPCYLETSAVSNINFYEKFGFSLIGDYKIQDVDVYCLLREPNGAIFHR